MGQQGLQRIDGHPAVAHAQCQQLGAGVECRGHDSGRFWPGRLVHPSEQLQLLHWMDAAICRAAQRAAPVCQHHRQHASGGGIVDSSHADLGWQRRRGLWQVHCSHRSQQCRGRAAIARRRRSGRQGCRGRARRGAGSGGRQAAAATAGASGRISGAGQLAEAGAAQGAARSQPAALCQRLRAGALRPAAAALISGDEGVGLATQLRQWAGGQWAGAWLVERPTRPSIPLRSSSSSKAGQLQPLSNPVPEPASLPLPSPCPAR